ncbi:ARIF-1 [Dione juno nucleopolyhedrovirus]|uniref:ARIF-1 n=1 Tax=Dione juno nucleopolyhedrovirus TaxID=2594175 RepID=A0AAF1D9Y0_9ABAC|nr:ARIF-1 [Dione juno nucleopolyhedrovirus]QDL56997.1 ARIF-1 [Dione juno nucleopolyhedrovirus]
MLNQINCLLQSVVYTVCTIAFVFSLMGTITDKYAVLLELEDDARSVINLSLLSAFLLGPIVFTAMAWIVHKIVLYFKKAQMRTNFYTKTLIVMAHLMALTCWGLFVAFQPQIYKNAHVPALDAMFRDYDIESLCWAKIVLRRYEVHDANAIRADFNCVHQDNFVKKCVGCRKEIRHDEPTVFNQNQSVFIILALTTIVVQCWSMYVHRKMVCHKSSSNNSQHDKNALFIKTEYSTDDDDDDDDDDDYEEERQSNIRMLEIVSENRRINNFDSLPPNNTFIGEKINFSSPITKMTLSPPSSPDSGFETPPPSPPHYDVPKIIVYNAPHNKIGIPAPPPMPLAPIVAPFNFKQSHVSNQIKQKY